MEEKKAHLLDLFCKICSEAKEEDLNQIIIFLEGIKNPGKTIDLEVVCSFCSKSSSKVERMIAGPSPTYICNECVGVCNDIIADYQKKDLTTKAQ